MVVKSTDTQSQHERTWQKQKAVNKVQVGVGNWTKLTIKKQKVRTQLRKKVVGKPDAKRHRCRLEKYRREIDEVLHTSARFAMAMGERQKERRQPGVGRGTSEKEGT